jgi:uncharacterized protein YecE (DUF72 family)
MAMQPLRIGTAGWNVSSRTVQVPPGGTHLQRYARVFNAVEINSSFHRPHQRKTYERWAASTPDDFLFAVKLPKTITHEQRLVECEAALARFAGEVTGLGSKLGVLLVQLPPKLDFDKRIAGSFFAELRAAIDGPVVLEPRHPGWFTAEAGKWLKAHEVARVAADPAPVEGAGEPGGWPGLAYYRWHGSPRMYYSAYDADALAALKQRLDASRALGIPVWCMFDNTVLGAALENALTLDTMK